MLKRAFDIVASALGLVVLSPVIVAVAAVVRATLGAPVLFRQMRPGLDGEPFVFIKFRTMRDAVDADGRPLPDAERMTPVGTFLRRTSLDEILQLWSVLRGDMSLVGPRPLLVDYLPFYSAEQARRHEVRPGITGWAQVNGRNAISWAEKFRLDVWYVDNRCFSLDLKILWLTARRVLAGSDIAATGHASMPRFDEDMRNR